MPTCNHPLHSRHYSLSSNIPHIPELLLMYVSCRVSTPAYSIVDISAIASCHRVLSSNKNLSRSGMVILRSPYMNCFHLLVQDALPSKSTRFISPTICILSPTLVMEASGKNVCLVTNLHASNLYNNPYGFQFINSSLLTLPFSHFLCFHSDVSLFVIFSFDPRFSKQNSTTHTNACACTLAPGIPIIPVYRKK